jgi:putative membrane-bound dehydrogenase-like protein
MRSSHVLWIAGLFSVAGAFAAPDANRLSHLDSTDPFFVQVQFPKLTTPQWVGEAGVESVVILAVDDMREPGPYEKFLRPILNKLKEIDGRAPVSIMCNGVNPKESQYQNWLKEGLSLEAHTLSHPCPILDRTNFQAAADTFLGSIRLLTEIPGNRPCAFRTPCCDSINSASPRLFAELFNDANDAGQFLTIDSSVINIFTSNDLSLARSSVIDAAGRGKFSKYSPSSQLATTIENYPYPYVIGRLCWEFPAACPSDWQASHLHGNTNPVTVADWKAGLDITVSKRGTFTMIFHPHGWMTSDQMVDLVDYAKKRYGTKTKFLTFREAQDRLDKNLLVGKPLRAANGQDNGVRLLDINNDGFLDVIIGNPRTRKTRIWSPTNSSWIETPFPTPLVTVDNNGNSHQTGVRFGVISTNGFPIMLVRNESTSGAWQFDGTSWVENPALLKGFELDGQPIFTSRGNLDRGVRFRDLNKDGICELIVGNESQSAIFSWSSEAQGWDRIPYALPVGRSIVDGEGRDNGLRFVDINEDGFDDVLFSNPKKCSLHLFVPEPVLGWTEGWTREVMSSERRGEVSEIPMIVRDGPHPNNGAWFHSGAMWIQNEDTGRLPGHIQRRTFKELVAGTLSLPKSPEESLAAMRVRPGFTIELVAAEPLVKDPVAFDWAADGKLWVVEMGDYPSGVDGKGKPGGVVRFLEDTKGDGHFDKSTVFLDGLNFPNGISPWRDGVIVSAPPEIFYAADTNGDGKADIHETLFTGFNEGNQQHRANGFDYGLDNWFYGANGDSGGTVTSVKTGKSVNINGRDFRFRPDDGAFETQAGQTQFGRHRDDWGNWFGNNNPNGSWHYFLPEQYLSRNPYVSVRSVSHIMPNYPEYTRVFPISRLAQRFNQPETANHLTSANSTTPYRDDLFGPDFANSYFVSEPVHNLIHREVLESDGVSFTSHRAPDELQSEFLASTDNWFRPTMMKTGPDGALYIADMYRQVIEHPEWIPEDFQKSVNVRAGDDKGRIYRVYPVGAKPRTISHLDRLDTSGLVAAMESPNGWQRDTVQRLLVERSDTKAVPPLENLLRRSPNPKTRVHALCTLDGLRALDADIVTAALRDQHPAVREHAVRVSEASFNKSGQLRKAVLALVHDSDIRVRYQLAFSLGEMKAPAAAEVLADIAVRDAKDERLQIAVRTSAPGHLDGMTRSVLKQLEEQSFISTAQGREEAVASRNLLRELVSLAVAMQDDAAIRTVLAAFNKTDASHRQFWDFAAMSGLLDGIARRKMTLSEFQSTAATDLKPLMARLNDTFEDARKIATDPSASEAERVEAIALLGRGPSGLKADLKELKGLLGVRNSRAIQSAVIANLRLSREKAVAEMLLSVWPGSSPVTREEILRLLLGRREWIPGLLTALETGTIPPAIISAAQQEKLRTHSDSAIREWAGKFFAVADSDRKRVLKQYVPVNRLKGDPTKGAGYFRQNCAPCHRLNNEGNAVAADLETVASKPVEYLMTAILDPNQSVEARYTAYTARTKDDLEYSGVIITETANSITLRQSGGKDANLLRSDIEELSGGGRSLMPEGFENILDPQALADLITYIRGGADVLRQPQGGTSEK